MKNAFRLLLAGLTLFAASPRATAQDDNIGSRGDARTSRYRFGIYVAPTVAWMKPTASKSNDGEFKSSSKGSSVGFMYGLMGEYYFAENYAVVSGLQMNMARGHIETKNTNPIGNDQLRTADFAYKLNYVEVPLNLKLRTDPVSDFRFFGQVGFTAGIFTGKKADYTMTYTDGTGNLKTATGSNEKIPGTLAISPLVVSMNIGAGAEYPITDKLAAYLGIFFNNGFAPDVTNPASYDFSGVPRFKDGNTRMNNIAFRFGLFF